MTLRPECSLGHSEYNAFLFATVGEEKVGLPLTVLTALTRLGFDPWREAARLYDLPKETAARAFAVTIAMLPEGDWKVSDSEAIAACLVNWLPGRSALAIPPVLALVEMRGSAVVLTPIGVRQVAKLLDRWEADEPEWPTFRLAVGRGEEGEIDALDLLRCSRQARA
jgi:hypothetical protein